MTNRTKLLTCLLLCLVFVAACSAALGASDEYPLWIGGTQVTAENCSQLSQNHWSYDPASHTLTLDNYTYSGLGYEYTNSRYAAIYYNGTENLTISLSGSNKITQSRDWAYDDDHVIRSDKADCTVTFAGSGSLDINMFDTWAGPAVFCKGPLVFSSGSVKAIGGNCGISASAITIKKEITAVEVQAYLDTAKAFNGKVINEVIGVGYNQWQQPTSIPADTAGKKLSYKEVGFPSMTFTLVYDPNDGLGAMDSEKVNEGEFFELPVCTIEPPEGKIFSHWEVSGVDLLGMPGSEVLITRSCVNNNTGEITVMARWAEAPAATIKTAPKGQECTYTGSPEELVTAGAAEHGTMQYVLGTDAETAPISDWSTDIPTGVDAKTYYVWYRAIGDETHSSSQKHCVTAVIRKKEATVTAKAQTIPEGSKPKSGVEYAELTDAANGHTLSAVTITADGNKLVPSAAKILGAKEQDVTGNYNITYVPGDLIFRSKTSVKVTFRVVNGEWDNGGSDDREVILTGHEGDVLKLQASQIPGAGTKPAASCKAGSWNTTPDTETAVTKDTTYIYTYAEDPVYTVTLQGDKYTQGNGKDFVFTVKRSIRDNVTFDSFVSVTMDGSPVSEKNYLKAAGSLVLTLKADYLDTLPAGDHKVVITFADGETKANLPIEKALPTPSPTPSPAPTATPRPVPHTGDSTHPAVWIGLLLLSLLGLFLVTAALKASRKK